MRSKDLTKRNIAYHRTLNQDVWKGRELRPEVRYKLLTVAKHFLQYLDVPDFKLLDIYLRGSLANYNYTDFSDFDLHLVTDFETVNCDLAEAFFKAKKQLYNDQHDIYIKGHEVELYVEDKDEQSASETLYSLLDDRWIKPPKFKRPSFDRSAINHKTSMLMHEIDDAIISDDPEDLAGLKEKIQKMRKSGLAMGGEYSVENLVFKILRNNKYIDKLNNALIAKQDHEMSLAERRKKKTKKHRYTFGGSWPYYGFYYGDSGDAGGDGGGGESLAEGWKTKALIGALAAVLAFPASADQPYPGGPRQVEPGQQQEMNPAARALSIYRTINRMKGYGEEGFKAEAQQEFNNIMRSIQGHPNQSKIFPILKDMIKDDTEQQDKEVPVPNTEKS